MIDARAAVVAHRSHRRVPRHPKVPGGPGHGVLVGADPAGDLRAGPFGKHSPWGDLRGLLGLRAGHAGCEQRHRRLAHTSTTGRSAIGRSRTTTRRRPWPIARTPQISHQAESSAVSTASHHSPLASSSSWVQTTNPSSPTNADTPLPLRSIRGLLSM